ncbi:MAG: hypothetical protein ABEL51_10230 [Salinibacter sp.]
MHPCTVTESADSSTPSLATWSILRIVLVLLVAALVLEMVLASQWTEPFWESSTWVLIGVVVGGALRGLGRVLAQRQRTGALLLRRLSLGIWIVAAFGGLVSLLF